MKKIQNILVPVNFSDRNDNAIATGIAMCKRHCATLHLLYVKEDNYYFYPGKFSKTLEMILEAEIAVLYKLESRARGIECEHDVPCIFYTAIGSFARAIGQKAAQFYCDVVVLEKPCKLLWDFSKRNAYEIMKSCPCPVLTIPSGRQFLDFKSIMFPLRSSVSPLPGKLNIAGPIISRNNADVILLPVNDHGATHCEELVNDFAVEVNGFIMDKKVDIESKSTSDNDIAAQVIDKALEKSSDLIIIPAVKKSGFMSFFINSFTEEIMKRSPIPVLSVYLA